MADPLLPRRLRLTVILAACLLAGCYDIQDTGDLSGGPDFAEAQGLNEFGDVVGYGSTATTNVATVWSAASGLTALPLLPGSTSCVANGINDNRLIAGACLLGSSGRKAAVTWSAGQVSAIGFPGVTLLGSEALAINGNGEVAGTYRELIGSGVLDFAFSWDSRTPFASPRGVTPLPADLSGSGLAAAINRTGWLAGNAIVSRGPGMHLAYLWNPASQRASPIDNIPTLPPGTAGEARGINDANQIVGVAAGKGFLFTPGPGQTVGTVTLLPFEPYDINNKGQIVGTRPGNPSSPAQQAVIYTISNGLMQDLAAQIPNFGSSGWQSLDLARAINDKGQIIGRGKTTAGAVHGFLMTPR